MKKKRDYQQPWTLPFKLVGAIGLMQGSITSEPTTSGGESNVHVSTWDVEGAANVDAQLWENQDDW